jgi:hypothetical protein
MAVHRWPRLDTHPGCRHRHDLAPRLDICAPPISRRHAIRRARFDSSPHEVSRSWMPSPVATHLAWARGFVWTRWYEQGRYKTTLATIRTAVTQADGDIHWWQSARLLALQSNGDGTQARDFLFSGWPLMPTSRTRVNLWGAAAGMWRGFNPRRLLPYRAYYNEPAIQTLQSLTWQ